MRYPISKTTEPKFHDVQIKTLSQIFDRSNRFRAILTQLTSNIFTSTVGLFCQNKTWDNGMLSTRYGTTGPKLF